MLFRQLAEDHWEILEVDGDGVAQLNQALNHFDSANYLWWDIIDRERSKASHRLRGYGIDCKPPGKDQYEDHSGWPSLTPEHERSLREFTRKKYKRFSFLDPSCHPVVKDEARLIDDGF